MAPAFVAWFHELDKVISETFHRAEHRRWRRKLRNMLQRSASRSGKSARTASSWTEGNDKQGGNLPEEQNVMDMEVTQSVDASTSPAEEEMEPLRWSAPAHVRLRFTPAHELYKFLERTERPRSRSKLSDDITAYLLSTEPLHGSGPIESRGRAWWMRTTSTKRSASKMEDGKTY